MIEVEHFKDFHRRGRASVQYTKLADLGEDHDAIYEEIYKRYERWQKKVEPGESTREERYFLAGIEQPDDVKAAIQCNRDLIVVGGYGRGKTYIARGLQFEYMMNAEYDSVTFVRCIDFNARTDIDALVAAPVLILDDFGVEDVTKAVAANYFDLLDQRYETGRFSYGSSRATVITSNLRLDEVVETLGSRTMDRLDASVVSLPDGTSRRHDPLPSPPRIETLSGFDNYSAYDNKMREALGKIEGLGRLARFYRALYDYGIYECFDYDSEFGPPHPAHASLFEAIIDVATRTEENEQ